MGKLRLETMRAQGLWRLSKVIMSPPTVPACLGMTVFWVRHETFLL